MSVDTDAAAEKWRGSSQTASVSGKTFETDTSTPSITTAEGMAGSSKLVSAGLETEGVVDGSGATSRPLHKTEQELGKLTLNEKLSSGFDTDALQAEDLFAQSGSKSNARFCCARYIEDHYTGRGRARAKGEKEANTSSQNMTQFSNPAAASTDSEQFDGAAEGSSALVTE